MKYYKYISILLIAFFISVTTGCNSSKPVSLSDLYKNNLIVHYIDVGQGDSILIQVNNRNLLIDAGPGVSTSNTVSYLEKQDIKKLDYVLETHPHEDHIGGMAEVISDFNIGEFYAPKVTANTTIFSKMVTALRSKNLKINVAKAGLSLDMGANVECDLLAPCNNNYSKNDLNLYSAVVKLTFKDLKFLFMGDAQQLNENEILSKNFDISCDVLKVGHHGSKTSSSKAFIEKCMPSFAVISVGKGNDYGHPNKQTLTTLKNIGCKIYRTDMDGTVVLMSDGKNIIRK